jgi:uncharacterized protein (DUF697 family)
MARTLWGDFGSIWQTVREVDVSAVRREAERRVSIVCAGDRAGLRHVERLLRAGPDRYPVVSSPLTAIPLDQITQHVKAVAAADLVIVALDTGAWLTDAEAAGLQALAAVDRRARILVVFGEPHQPLPPWVSRVEGGVAAMVDPRGAGASEHLASPVLKALPADLHLAAARRLPGLRMVFSHRLTTEVALSNATVAVASGLPSAFLALGVPIAAADTVILTKNQALMVYRLALAHGAPPEFRRRMVEIAPVVGGAVVWRQVAGGLVGLVPGYGVLPKTAVAYAGTYITGRAAELWYQRGVVGKDDLRRISAEATAKAKAAAAQMMVRARGARHIGRR